MVLKKREGARQKESGQSGKRGSRPSQGMVGTVVMFGGGNGVLEG